MTSKLQVTIPKLLAEQCRIRPGDEIEWRIADGAIRIVPTAAASARLSVEDRLRLFDAATRRQRERHREAETSPASGVAARGWSREDLYDRGRPD